MEIQQKQIDPDIAALELSGRMVLGRESQRIEWIVEDLIKHNCKKLVFDFANVSYIDSAGVGILVGCTGKLKAAGGQLRIAGTTDRVLEIFRMTGVDQVLLLDGTMDAACAGLGGA
jgi:anti-sigma B factor antagonist